MQQSRWEAVLPEEGGIGAAVSEESMRRQKYCLQWLQALYPLELSSLYPISAYSLIFARMSSTPFARSSMSCPSTLEPLSPSLRAAVYASSCYTSHSHKRAQRRVYRSSLEDLVCHFIRWAVLRRLRVAVAWLVGPPGEEYMLCIRSTAGAGQLRLHARGQSFRCLVPAGKPKSIAGAGGGAGAGGTGRASDCWYGADFDAHDGGLGYDAWCNGGYG